MEVIIYVILGILFATFEGVIYYDPFKKNKFWSRKFFTRIKKTFLDKYFPIDGPHLTKQAIVVLICTLPLFYRDLKYYEYILYPIINYTALSLVFNILLNYYQKLSVKK